jgi:hypothetical protein
MSTPRARASSMMPSMRGADFWPLLLMCATCTGAPLTALCAMTSIRPCSRSALPALDAPRMCTNAAALWRAAVRNVSRISQNDAAGV